MTCVLNTPRTERSKDGILANGTQGWRSGGRTRLPLMCPGFDSRNGLHNWVEFVGSVLERFFPLCKH